MSAHIKMATLTWWAFSAGIDGQCGNPVANFQCVFECPRVSYRTGKFMPHDQTRGVTVCPDMEIGTADTNLRNLDDHIFTAVSYTHLRAHETRHDLVCRL